MNSNSGKTTFTTGVNVWGLSSAITSLRVIGETVLGSLRVLGTAIFTQTATFFQPVFFKSNVTFDVLPTSLETTPTVFNQLATKNYVDSYFQSGPQNIFDSNNTWTNTNKWTDDVYFEGKSKFTKSCEFLMNADEYFLVGEEFHSIGNFIVHSTTANIFAGEALLSGNIGCVMSGGLDLIPTLGPGGGSLSIQPLAVTLQGYQALNLTGTKSVNVTAAQMINMTGIGNVNIKGNLTTIEGVGDVNIAAAGAVGIDSDDVNIAAAVDISIEAVGDVNLAADVVTVEALADVNIAAVGDVGIESASCNIATGGATTISAGGAIPITAGGVVTVTGLNCALIGGSITNTSSQMTNQVTNSITNTTGTLINLVGTGGIYNTVGGGGDIQNAARWVTTTATKVQNIIATSMDTTAGSVSHLATGVVSTRSTAAGITRQALTTISDTCGGEYSINAGSMDQDVGNYDLKSSTYVNIEGPTVRLQSVGTDRLIINGATGKWNGVLFEFSCFA